MSSPVIKLYILIPIPVQIGERGIDKSHLAWQDRRPVSWKLSVSLYQWMNQCPMSRTLWN